VIIQLVQADPCLPHVQKRNKVSPTGTHYRQIRIIILSFPGITLLLSSIPSPGSSSLPSSSSRSPGYRSGGQDSIPDTTRKKKKVVGLERGPFRLVSTTEELLDRKVAAV
jgi:hypothetical protein